MPQSGLAAEAAAQLAAIVASSSDAIVSETLEGIVASWNKSAADLYGYSEEEMIGQSIRRVIPADRQDEEEVFLAKIAAGGRIDHYETLRLHKAGRLIEVSISLSPVRNAEGRIIGAAKIARDSTPQKKAEAALRASEARFRATFENAPFGVAHVAPGGSWLIVNPRLCEITGYTSEELLSKTFQDITHPDDLNADLAQMQRMLEGKSDGYSTEKRYFRKDGSIVWVNLRVGCVRKPDGPIDYFISATTEISEQKRSEFALHESSERLRLANEAAGIGTFTVDLETNTASYSAELSVMLGIPGVRSAGIDAALARVHRDDLSRISKLYFDAISGKDGGHVKMDFRFVRPGGEIRWMTWIGRVHFRETLGGLMPYSILGACLDITERKRDEERIGFLMHEVNHRSKNLLALVQAIAWHTAAAGTGDFIARFDTRLRALAASQDLLFQSEWKGADLEQIVRSQLAHFEDLSQSRIELKGKPVFISSAAAQSIGMAIHELATNAGKYGALSNKKGRVHIHWGLEPSEDGRESFRMDWRETGGPIVEPPAKTGFGSTVVTYMIKSSLEADVELAFAASGLSWSLRCPATNVKQHPKQP